ncbi:hypothetical protein A9X06_06885 [Mycobacterium sp. 852002-51759_SCH5129042]|nr:hypothetical protein A9X06_06885 [Mycobacterium sp. 852002-51759_SCH5129042]
MLAVKAFQARGRAALEQKVRHVRGQSRPQLRVGQLSLLPLPFDRLSLQPCTFFSLRSFLEAGLVRGISGLTSLSHLLGVRAEPAQLRECASLPRVPRVLGLVVLPFDVLHDAAELTGDLLAGFAFDAHPLIAPSSILLQP